MSPFDEGSPPLPDLQRMYHEGERDSLPWLWRIYEQSLRRHAEQVSMGRLELADLGLVRAEERLDQESCRKRYDPEKPWSAFAAVIVKNAVRDLLRTKRGRQVSYSQADPDFLPPDDETPRERLDPKVKTLLNEAFQALTEAEKEVVISYDLLSEGAAWSMKDVSKLIGKDLTVCQSLYRSAKKRMRKHLIDRGVGSFSDVL